MANELFSSGEQAAGASQEQFGVAPNMASNVVEFPSVNTEKIVENTNIDDNAYPENNMMNTAPMQTQVATMEPFVMQQHVDWNNKISSRAAGKVAKQIQAEVGTVGPHKAQEDLTRAKIQFGVIQGKAA